MLGEAVSFFFNRTLLHLSRLRYFVYGVTPAETSYPNVHSVPEYFLEAYLLAIGLTYVEEFIQLARGDRTRNRFHDRHASYIIMSILMLVKISLYGGTIAVYCWIYDHYRLVDLPYNSTLTWVGCFLWIDFIYYWLHRARHEVHILWADHQLHHSGEDYNFNISFRISPIEYGVLFVYLAVLCAPIIPPGVGLVHMQLFYLYQYTLHTELIPHLGPVLEFVLNTPSAHRVHHGRTRECIDKNYGATLIIWDRLFGTFQSEKGVTQKPLKYGLVQPVQTFNPLTLALAHYWDLARMTYRADGARNKLKTLFYGPGWSPGKSRLGDLSEVPLLVAAGEEKFDIPVPLWFECYARLTSIIHATNFYFVLLAPEKSWSLILSIGIMSLTDGLTYQLCITNQQLIPFLSAVRSLIMVQAYDHVLTVLPSIVQFMNANPFLWYGFNGYILLFILLGFLFTLLFARQVHQLIISPNFLVKTKTGLRRVIGLSTQKDFHIK